MHRTLLERIQAKIRRTMPLRVEVYEPRHEPEAAAFNQRIHAAGMDPGFVLPHVASRGDSGLAMFFEQRVVLDGARIRGGYLLQWRDFWVQGYRRRLCALQSPISEGIINRKYAGVGGLMIRHALSINPRIYAVGMGGVERPLPAMLKWLGFTVGTVPFVFRVNRAGSFLQEIKYLRTSPSRRMLLDFIHRTGVGWLALKAVEIGRRTYTRRSDIETDIVDSLDNVADEVWEDAHQDYSLVGVRDAEVLRLLYPANAPKFSRIAVRSRAGTIGWAVTMSSQMRENKYFGNMTVGVIADALARPRDAGAVVETAARHLAHSGVDVIVANFQHSAWIDACRASGFFRGPSNHCLALSPTLAGDLSPDAPLTASVHISRGDSDGLTNL